MGLTHILMLIFGIVVIVFVYGFYVVGTHPAYTMISKVSSDPIVRIVGTGRIILEVEKKIQEQVIENVRSGASYVEKKTAYGYVVMDSDNKDKAKPRRTREQQPAESNTYLRDVMIIAGSGAFALFMTVFVYSSIKIFRIRKARAVMAISPPFDTKLVTMSDGKVVARLQMKENADVAEWNSRVDKYTETSEEMKSSRKRDAMERIMKNETEMKQIVMRYNVRDIYSVRDRNRIEDLARDTQRLMFEHGIRNGDIFLENAHRVRMNQNYRIEAMG